MRVGVGRDLHDLSHSVGQQRHGIRDRFQDPVHIKEVVEDHQADVDRGNIAALGFQPQRKPGSNRLHGPLEPEVGQGHGVGPRSGVGGSLCRVAETGLFSAVGLLGHGDPLLRR
ncbi:hypothetical protein AOC05_17555 [Arthrobacter alpinus]|uniref:Uncharacterized protein n=1 Tax=Arthrobacter alpinus TaxID=656366 RepID=A0A0M4R0Z1_9MICC|nr:hypothetical protein AOC05_17555 [Arthrobacter alpinus]